MKKILFFLIVAGISVSLAAAETALKIKGPADFKNSAGNKLVKAVPGGVSLTIGSGSVHLFSGKTIPIDLKKKYLVSLEYRLAPGSKPGCAFYVAPVSYNAQGKIISCESQYITEGTETVLAAPVKKGDKILKIKNGAKWIAKHGAVAFYVKKDLADLPNLDTLRIASMKKEKDCWTVNLRWAASKAYPAGTAVRNHRDGATYRYVGGHVKAAPQWKKASRILQGALRERTPGYEKTWRPGTVKAGIIVMSSSGKGAVEIRNISITEVK